MLTYIISMKIPKDHKYWVLWTLQLPSIIPQLPTIKYPKGSIKVLLGGGGVPGCGPFTGLLSNQGEKSINFYFHKGSFKKKVLKYGTPKPSLGPGIVEHRSAPLQLEVRELCTPWDPSSNEIQPGVPLKGSIRGPLRGSFKGSIGFRVNC